MQSKKKPYVLLVAELIYSKVCELKEKNPELSNINAIENCIDTVRNDVLVADAKKLPYKDKSFDIVISINTIHNLAKDECAMALQEIERVKRIDSFVTVDAFRNEEEKERMYAWNLTAKTIMSVEEWKNFFKEVGYTGDYYWFIP